VARSGESSEELGGTAFFVTFGIALLFPELELAGKGESVEELDCLLVLSARPSGLEVSSEELAPGFGTFLAGFFACGGEALDLATRSDDTDPEDALVRVVLGSSSTVFAPLVLGFRASDGFCALGVSDKSSDDLSAALVPRLGFFSAALDLGGESAIRANCTDRRGGGVLENISSEDESSVLVGFNLLATGSTGSPEGRVLFTGISEESDCDSVSLLAFLGVASALLGEVEAVLELGFPEASAFLGEAGDLLIRSSL